MIVKPAHTLVALACALTCFAAQAEQGQAGAQQASAGLHFQ